MVRGGASSMVNHLLAKVTLDYRFHLQPSPTSPPEDPAGFSAPPGGRLRPQRQKDRIPT